ncbi:MAG: hypothetical protein ACK45H_07140 [Bacteroidota bacterium]|jgi:hypothetical protein
MANKYTFYLDFDGTVVEHAYPEIGAKNPGSIDVIRKLQHAGHTIILNTYRADLDPQSLEAAIHYLEQKEHGLEPMHDVTPAKIHPPDWNWDAFMSTGVIFIDDTCKGTPLRRNMALEYGFMVDWNVLHDWFSDKGLFE